MKSKKVCFCKKCGALDYADEKCPKCGSPEIDEASMDFLLFGNIVTIHGLGAAYSNDSGRYSEFCFAKIAHFAEQNFHS